MQTDFARLQLEFHHPALEEESFQEIMRQNLARAPWLLLSVAVHAVALMLALLVVPEPRRAAEPKVVAIVPEADEPDIPDERDIPPELPEPVPEPKEPDFFEHEVPIETPADQNEPAEDPDDTPIQSAFDSDQWNTSIGPGGGAAGKGGLGGGKYTGRGSGPPSPVLERALDWLARHQDDCGRWDADGFMKHDTNGEPCNGAGDAVHDVGVTGLALLAFLGEGSTMRHGKYREQIKRGIIWLKQGQAANGLFGTNATNDFIYDHCIATIAMCEAMGLSHYRILRKPAQRAINYLESHRNPYGVWRYQPRSGDNDTSVTGWALMALRSAKDFGLMVNDNAFRATAEWFDSVTDAASGRCGYTGRGGVSSRQPGDHATDFPPEKGETLAAVGLFSRFFLGQDPGKTKVMHAAADTILARPPRNLGDGSIDHYYWYYATYALYQFGGSHWREWSKALTPAVVKTQRADGNFKGSWDPNGAWGESGGRVYSTALLALTLQAYNRYTRVLIR